MIINFIEVLRFLATLLIANSHFKGVYPIDSLAFGGGFGLSVFYMLIGYLSAKIDSKTKFLPWYLKKILRLYISLWIVRLLELLLGYLTVPDFYHFLMSFVFPTHWFVASVVVLYAVYFVFYKYLVYPYGLKAVKGAMSAIAILFAVLYFSRAPIGLFSFESLHCNSGLMDTPSLMMQCIWAFSMLLGCALKMGKGSFRTSFWKFSVILFACLIVFCVIKGYANQNHLFAIKWLLGPCYIVFALNLFVFFSSIECWCQKFLASFFGTVVKMISSSSVEIYYVQFFWINCLKDKLFPVNLILLVVTITITGYLIHLIAERIFTVIGGYIWKKY